MLVIILKRGSDVWMINVQPALKKPQTIKSISHTSTYELSTKRYQTSKEKN